MRIENRNINILECWLEPYDFTDGRIQTHFLEAGITLAEEMREVYNHDLLMDPALATQETRRTLNDLGFTLREPWTRPCVSDDLVIVRQTDARSQHRQCIQGRRALSSPPWPLCRRW